MKRLFILIYIALCQMLLNYGLHARTVEGVVTCGGKKLSDVIVTDGFKFTKTKKNGEFKMDVADSARFVYIVTPSGYAGDWSSGAPQFYQKIDERDTYSFDLCQTISGLEGPAVGLVLGDVCFNKYHLMDKWKSVFEWW